MSAYATRMRVSLVPAGIRGIYRLSQIGGLTPSNTSAPAPCDPRGRPGWRIGICRSRDTRSRCIASSPRAVAEARRSVHRSVSSRRLRCAPSPGGRAFGRGATFDWRTLAAWRKRNVRFATLSHAAGLSSTGDPALDQRLPFDEFYNIPESCASAVCEAKRKGRRVIAIGTTVRARSRRKRRRERAPGRRNCARPHLARDAASDRRRDPHRRPSAG